MSDAKRIRDYKKSRQPKPPISKAEHRANCETVVNLLMPIIEKMRKSPQLPVKESLADLMAEFNSGEVRRQPVIVNNHLGELIKYNTDGTKEILNSGGEKTAVRASDLLTKTLPGVRKIRAKLRRLSLRRS